MKDILQVHDLQGVVTPVTHTTGSALDVHIPKDAQRYRARSHTIKGNLSDHSASMVETDLTIIMDKYMMTQSPAQTVQRVMETQCERMGNSPRERGDADRMAF